MPRSPLAKVGPKQVEAIQLRVQGMALDQIGFQLGVNRRTVAWWFESPVVQAMYDELTEPIRIRATDILRKGADHAATYICAAVQPNHELYKRINGNGIKAAQLILDRVGLAAYMPRAHEVERVEELEDLDTIRQVLRQLGPELVAELMQEEAA